MEDKNNITVRLTIALNWKVTFVFHFEPMILSLLRTADEALGFR